MAVVPRFPFNCVENRIILIGMDDDEKRRRRRRAQRHVMLRTSVDIAVAGSGSPALGGMTSIISKNGGDKGKQDGVAQIRKYGCNWYDMY